MHYIALAYPKDPSFAEMRHYWAFFTGLGNVIPCAYCAAHYKKHLSLLPIDTYLEEGKLFEWTVEIHNMVNKENGKPVVSPDEAFLLLLNDNCNCTSDQDPPKKKGNYRKKLARAIKTIAKENPGMSASERMRLAHILAKA
jgi:hypothetical protein